MSENNAMRMAFTPKYSLNTDDFDDAKDYYGTSFEGLQAIVDGIEPFTPTLIRLHN